MKRFMGLFIIFLLFITSCQKSSGEVTQENIKAFNCQRWEIQTEPPFKIYGDDETPANGPTHEEVVAYHSLYLVKQISAEEAEHLYCTIMVFNEFYAAEAQFNTSCGPESVYTEGGSIGDAACVSKYEEGNLTTFIYGNIFVEVAGTVDGALIDEMVSKIDGRLKGELELPQKEYDSLPDQDIQNT